MKPLFLPLLALIIYSPTALATTNPVKTCDTRFGFPGEVETQTLIKIFKNGDAYSAQIDQKTDGESTSYTEVATVTSATVAADLSSDTDPFSLNLAEKLIVHAMMWESEPELSKLLNFEFALKDVRSATVFKIGKTTETGLSAVVDAYDAKGQLLGSFLGGFLISRCL